MLLDNNTYADPLSIDFLLSSLVSFIHFIYVYVYALFWLVNKMNDGVKARIYRYA